MMPRKEPEPQPSRSEKLAVYRNEACQAVFSSPENAEIRTKKAVKSLINENHLSVAGLSTKRLNAVLRSLQEDRVFESSIFAQAAFPELRPSELVEPAPVTAPASVPTQAQATMGEGFEGVITLHDNEPLVVDMMIQYLYLLDYKPAHDPGMQLAESKQNASAIDLLLHAKVYAIADNYAIDGLKALAVVKFKSSAGEAWNTKDFLDAAIEAYSSTIDTDRDMRNAVIQVFASRKELLELDEVKKLVRKLDQLAYDLLLYFHNEGRIL
ncbi:BTB/POZ domain-containing protein [Pyricularia oryzae]|nr:BTB/POZ domain-containing protein [Pyricularia oryzae]